VLYCPHVSVEWFREDVMKEKTCAACDCELVAGSIKVTIGGRTVEVCCDDRAQRLKEAHASAAARRA
jgi:hypothetical protein